MDPTSLASDRATRLAELTGRRSGSKHPESVTAAGGGGKFTPEGTPLAYPGNTFLCHVDPTSPAFEALGAMQDRLRRWPTADSFAFLPKASFHVTIFGGVAGDPLRSEGWPADLAPEAPLHEVTALFLERLRGQPGAAGMRLRAERCDLGTSVKLVERDAASGRVLRRLRDTLREATGLERADHHAYAFHVTLAYQTRWLDAALAPDYLDALDGAFLEAQGALGDIELGPVEACEFDTMEAFRPVALFGPDGVRSIDERLGSRPGARS